MLSVLIPVYNYNAYPLFEEIHKQLTESEIIFEIICFDDASDEVMIDPNIKLKSFTFQKLEKNIGRSKIRNLLAEKAKYDWLLFLDADVLPEKSNFIKNYLGFINDDYSLLVCGGIKYREEKPSKEKMLRWVYGKKREEVSLKLRKLNPYQHFLSSNFLIHKSIFSNIRFNEKIKKYGHEDTLLAINLKSRGKKIKHIDNSVFHEGIETNSVFIEKTKGAVENIFDLYKEKLVDRTDVKLLRIFSRLGTFKMLGIIKIFFHMFYRILETNLYSNSPSLLVFDIYKLGYLSSIYKK